MSNLTDFDWIIKNSVTSYIIHCQWVQINQNDMSENISYINSIKITLQHNVPETLKNVELWRPNLTKKRYTCTCSSF